MHERASESAFTAASELPRCDLFPLVTSEIQLSVDVTFDRPDQQQGYKVIQTRSEMSGDGGVVAFGTTTGTN